MSKKLIEVLLEFSKIKNPESSDVFAINEFIAREVFGFVGSKPINGDFPWDIGVRPEDSEFDGKSEPKGGTHPFFSSRSDGSLTVYRSGMGAPFSPATCMEDAALVVEALSDLTPVQLILSHVAQRLEEMYGPKEDGDYDKTSSA